MPALPNTGRAKNWAISSAIVLTFLIAIAVTQLHKAAPIARPELPPDLAIIPGDAVQLWSVNFGAYWTGPEAESLQRLANADPVVATSELKELPSRLGIDAENVDRMLQFSTTSGEFVKEVTTREPYDLARVLAAIAPGAEARTTAGKQYFYSAITKNSVAMLNNCTLMLSQGDDLPSFLNRPASSTQDALLNRALAAIANGAPFVVHIGAESVRHIASDPKFQNGPLKSLARATDWQIITEVDNGLAINLAADFDTKEAADSASAAIAFICEKLTWYLSVSMSHMTPFLQQESQQYADARELIPQLAKAIGCTCDGLKNVRVTSDNCRAQATVVINTDQPLATTVLLLTMSPRGEKRTR